MLTSRLLGVPSVLVALASLAPLTLARPDVAPVQGTGSGVIVLPEAALGEMRGTLIDVTGAPAYLLRAQLESFPVFYPGSRLGSLDGRLYEPYSGRLVGTLRGSWREEQGMGVFEAQVHPVDVPDPHHFVAGYLRGRFELKEGVPVSEEIVVQPPQSSAERAAAMRLRLRAQAMRRTLASEELRIAPKVTIGRVAHILPRPAVFAPRTVAHRAAAQPDVDVAYFQLDWWIDGLI